MEKKEEWGEAHVAFVDKARERGGGGGGKKEEKSEEEEKESDSKVGRSARFRRARRAGHSSILASRADGLSLPLPLRPSSSSSFSSGKLSALSLSLSLSRSVLEREKRGFCSVPLVSRVHRHQQPSLNDSRQL